MNVKMSMRILAGALLAHTLYKACRGTLNLKESLGILAAVLFATILYQLCRMIVNHNAEGDSIGEKDIR